MPKRPTPKSLARARALRRDMSFPERLVWSRLRAGRLDGLKFRRQAPVGPFVADFLCDSARLVVELDGRSHDEYDAARTRWLGAHGYRVVRYQHDEVLADLEAVLKDMAHQCGRDVSEW